MKMWIAVCMVNEGKLYVYVARIVSRMMLVAYHPHPFFYRECIEQKYFFVTKYSRKTYSTNADKHKHWI